MYTVIPEFGINTEKGQKIVFKQDRLLYMGLSHYIIHPWLFLRFLFCFFPEIIIVYSCARLPLNVVNF